MTTLTSFLAEIEEKVNSKIRLTREEGLKILEAKDEGEIAEIGRLANQVRKRDSGETVTYASTLNINPTNLCELNCTFCSFYAKPGWDKAWFLTPEAIEKKIRSKISFGLTEIHIVGGLWRDCDLNYYQELFTRIKGIDPHLHIKALTPVEYDFLAKQHGLTIEQVFEKMISWGLGSLPGGGAEILVESIRKKIAPGKITSDEYLHVHKIAHQLGLHSNITMLFGHIEENEDILTHLCKVRDLQDETKGFKNFIPLKFNLENNALGKRKNQLKTKHIPLVYAVSRLMLDNFPKLKVLWNYVGVQEALEILDWGACDLSSTNFEEKIIVMAGSKERPLDRETMEELIKSRGRIPKLIHSGEI